MACRQCRRPHYHAWDGLSTTSIQDYKCHVHGTHIPNAHLGSALLADLLIVRAWLTNPRPMPGHRNTGATWRQSIQAERQSYPNGRGYGKHLGKIDGIVWPLGEEFRAREVLFVGSCNLWSNQVTFGVPEPVGVPKVGFHP